VGSALVAANSGSRAVLWRNGAKTDLTPGVQGSSAEAINDAGQIVGTTNHGMAFLWQNGVTTNLGHLGGGGSFGADLNNAGQAVGASYTTHVTELGPMPHAFLWQNGVMTDLGVLPGEEDSGAGAINNLGQIVGSSGRTDPVSYEVTSRSFLYDGGVMTALPVPSWQSYAGDINDSGVIVGTMRAAGGYSNFHAYIYADGVVRNLNSLIPAGSGLHLAYATGINNAGQIVGVAYDSRATYHAFLLTPVASGTPVVSINDVSKNEGDSGTTQYTFTVNLSPASASAVTVNFATANGSAKAGEDYDARSGVVTFNAGETSRTLAVNVRGDRKKEAQEVFYVNLSGASGAFVAVSQGTGVVRNDDR
jgi:probable HAF family extracellular repeat protein